VVATSGPTNQPTKPSKPPTKLQPWPQHLMIIGNKQQQPHQQLTLPACALVFIEAPLLWLSTLPRLADKAAQFCYQQKCSKQQQA